MLFRARRGDITGERLVKRFKIRSTPFMLFLDGDGAEIDWIAGYEPPPEKLLRRLRNIAQGIDSLPSLERARKQDPGDPEPLIKLGLKYQARHDRDEAISLFNQAAALDPAGKRMTARETGALVSFKELADFHMAEAYVATFGVIRTQPLKDFIKAYPASPLVKDAYFVLSRFNRLDDESGRGFYDSFLSRFPDDPEVIKSYLEKAGFARNPQIIDAIRGRCIELAGRLLAVYSAVTPDVPAKTQAQLLIEKGDPVKADSAYGPEFMTGQIKSWSDSLLTYAEFWLNQKRNLDDAEAAILKALELDPGSPEVHRRAAAAYQIHLGKPDKALGIYGPAYLPQISQDAQALYDYFKFWQTLKMNLESAEGALEALWRLKPDTVHFRIGAAGVFLNAGLNERALSVFGPDFATSRNDDLSALYDYGMFWLTKQANRNSAVAALTRAMTLSPGPPSNHLRVATLLFNAKMPEAVQVIFGPGYLPSIKDDPDALTDYAQFWLDKGMNRESALQALDMAVKSEDLSPFIRTRLPYLLGKAGMPERIDEFFGASHLPAIMDDPTALEIYASYWAYQGKNLSAALKAAERGCRIDAQNPNQWASMAQVLKSLGRFDDALRAIDKAISLEEYTEDKAQHEPLRKEIVGLLGKR